MMLTMMKGKIHRASVTGADLHYEGSITVDPVLLEASGILPHEQVDVLNITNGQRFTTYTIEAPTPGNGDIFVNGAAARLVQKGDLVIICAFAHMEESEARQFTPRVVLVDGDNAPKCEGAS
jgi:aspartate 1-decarboxylase